MREELIEVRQTERGRTEKLRFALSMKRLTRNRGDTLRLIRGTARSVMPGSIAALKRRLGTTDAASYGRGVKPEIRFLMDKSALARLESVRKGGKQWKVNSGFQQLRLGVIRLSPGTKICTRRCLNSSERPALTEEADGPGIIERGSHSAIQFARRAAIWWRKGCFATQESGPSGWVAASRYFFSAPF